MDQALVHSAHACYRTDTSSMPHARAQTQGCSYRRGYRCRAAAIGRAIGRAIGQAIGQAIGRKLSGGRLSAAAIGRGYPVDPGVPARSGHRRASTRIAMWLSAMRGYCSYWAGLFVRLSALAIAAGYRRGYRGRLSAQLSRRVPCCLCAGGYPRGYPRAIWWAIPRGSRRLSVRRRPRYRRLPGCRWFCRCGACVEPRAFRRIASAEAIGREGVRNSLS